MRKQVALLCKIADEFVITHAHSFGTGTQHDYNVKEIAEHMSSTIIKLDSRVVYCKL